MVRFGVVEYALKHHADAVLEFAGYKPLLIKHATRGPPCDAEVSAVMSSKAICRFNSRAKSHVGPMLAQSACHG